MSIPSRPLEERLFDAAKCTNELSRWVPTYIENIINKGTDKEKSYFYYIDDIVYVEYEGVSWPETFKIRAGRQAYEVKWKDLLELDDDATIKISSEEEYLIHHID
jgi:hypothetical protein